MTRVLVLLFFAACSSPLPPPLREPLLCSRSADGLRCAIWDGVAFSHDRIMGDRVFGDAGGFGVSPSRWATVQLVEIDRHRTPAVCGRGPHGIECALRAGGGFDIPRLSSVFADDDGFDDYRYAATLQFVDADGDGIADACARSAGGVSCAHGLGDGTFAPPRSLDEGFFSDERGFAAATRGGTLQFGDLDGDGRADYCLRGGDGIYCSLARASGFSAPSRWSSDFGDAQDWGGLGASRSLALVDVDGDGRADLCGANASGVSCARSSGSAFGPARTWTSLIAMVGDDRKLSTPQFGDLDGDGRADVCGHTDGELRCLFSSGDHFEAPISFGHTGSLDLVDLDGDGRVELCWQDPGGFTCTQAVGRHFHAVSTALIGGDVAVGAGLGRAARRRVEPLLNPTARENLRPGTPGWWVPMPQQARDHEVEAYTDQASYRRDDFVQVFASTAREEDPIEWMVLRTGWYGGVGAREIANGSFAGHRQPLPAKATATMPARCQWKPTFTFQLPHHSVSGVYVLRLDNRRTRTSYLTTFVVRDDERQAELTMQRSDLTDAAYNNWDGESNLSSWYFGNPFVSLDRPLRTPFSFGFDMSYSAGYFTYEVSMVRFLERQGYDVKYVSDLDTDARAITGTKAFLIAGHDEYWSAAMRDHVEGARDSGVHLGFFGSDMLDGEIQFLDARTFSPAFPGTTQKRTWAQKPIDLSRPPHDNPSDTLTGTHLGDWCGNVHPDCLDTGDGQPFARLAESDAFHLVAAHPVLRGLPLERPLLPHSVGYEYEVPLTDLSPLPFVPRILARAPSVAVQGQHPVMLAYQTRSGTRVFNAGSMQISHGLDGWAGRAAFRVKGGEARCHRGDKDCFDAENPAIQQLAVNVLADLGAQPATPSSGVDLRLQCDWNHPGADCRAELP
jgi:hypothetical protein